MNDRAQKVSGKLAKKASDTGRNKATKSSPKSSGKGSNKGAKKTGRIKRPSGKTAKTGKGKVTRSKTRSVAERQQELEPITPFPRGVSIGVKFAVFTAAVVGLFMGLQGYLTYSIAAQEMDTQINEQGVSMANTLEKTLDRSLWLERQDYSDDPDAPPPSLRAQQADYERLLADWKRRLAELGDSYEKIRQVLVVEISESGNRQSPVVRSSEQDFAIHQALLREDKDPETGKVVLRVHEGKIGDERVRRFDRRIELDELDRDHAITTALEEWARALDAETYGDATRAEMADRLRGLTHADPDGDMLLTYDDWLAWRNDNPPLMRRDSWSERSGGSPPWVSIFVTASSLDELKAALWQRVAVVTACGAGAGILLTVLIATILTGPIREMEGDVAEVARGNLDHQTRVGSRDEVGALAHTFNIMIRNLRTAQSNAVERQAFERELNIAKEIQEKLLPERIPQIPGIDIHSHYNSAKEVGGDYYDFIVIDQTHLGIIVADVAGKGIPGAMVMTMARSLVRLASVRNISPADTFKKVNRILAKDIRRGMFVTAAYMVLNVKTRQLKVASAGHNPVVLYRAAAGDNELVKPAGIALGFDKGTIFDNHIKEVEVKLEPGDRIVTYTDGVNEAMNNHSEEFGDERFYDLVKRHAEKPSKDFVEAIVKALDDHRGSAEQSDDITITTLKVLGDQA